MAGSATADAVDERSALLPTFAVGTCRAPRRPRGLVPRDGLVEELASTEAELIVVTAPAGYGKTTTMLLWDDADARPFAWINLDRLDDDPVHLLRHVGCALDAIEPLDADVRRILDGPGRSPVADLLPALAAELARRPPTVLVVDDVHLVTGEAATSCLDRLVDLTPDGCAIALVGRSTPTVGVPRRRLADAVVELDAARLALTTDEATDLFAAMAVTVDRSTVTELVERTEGWPGGLHLAGLGLATGSGALAGVRVTGRDRRVAAYLVEEVLGRLDPDTVDFLERSSVLDRMSPALLDDLLGTTTAAEQLHRLEDSGNLFLVALDDTREWYRYHHLFGELLRARLRDRDPATYRELHLRASERFERSGNLDDAVDHAVEGGATDRAARLALDHAPHLVLSGQAGTLGRWLDRLDAAGASHSVDAALASAWLGIGLADVGRIHGATALAARAGSGALLADGRTPVTVAVAMLRANAGIGGLAGIIDNTEIVLRTGDETMTPWWGLAVAIRATALSALDQLTEARTGLFAARPAVADFPAYAAALEAHLALVDVFDDDQEAAERHLQRARHFRDRYDLEAVPLAMISFAVDALVSARAGRRDEARRNLEIAASLLRRLDDSVPRTALLGHTVAARAALLIGDRPNARLHVKGAAIAQLAEPNGHRLNRELDEIRAQLDAGRGATPTGPGLTPAELRVLPFLATHLSLKEIATELIISRNTAKSHAVAIYRKLGATSRSEAVALATEQGLLPG